MKNFSLSVLIALTLLLGGRATSIAQTTLSAGDLVIIAINGDNDPPNYGRGFSFMPLVNLATGTEINFTDYGWSDVTGAFITNNGIADAFIHYTAPSAITAGTIIRCDSYHNTNFTYDYSYTGSGNNYLNIAGLTQGDELLVFQGLRSSPTFICAASIVSTSIVASGWATSVGTNGTDDAGAGSALPGSGSASVVDLVDDGTALSFNQALTANDNCAYSGPTTAATKAQWQTRVQTYSNWTFNDAVSIPTPLVGPFYVGEPVVAPTVTTQAVSSIAATTATGNGNITSLGVPNPTAHGVCWNITGTPTTSDSKVDKGAASVTGAFTASMTGLTANTTYYVRAFATNTANTSYGTEVSFTTLVVAPTTQASAIVFSSVQTTQMTIGWTNGNGSKRAVFVKEGSGTITNPTDNTTYTASANWASKGTQLGSSGYYCVYNNNSNSFTLTGLSSATQYTVQIFEYNGPALGEKYNITTATNNPKSQTSNSLIKYVDGSKTDDSGDGFTWSSAKKTLQAAIDISVSGDQIWIKTGTYIPTVAAGGSGTRYKTFTLKDGLAIYGGFAGTETNLTQRVVKNNPTILSGDLNGDDDYTANPWTNITENVYHVIYMPGALNLTSTVILDGLIISGGNANETLKGGLHGIYGGGMYFEGSISTQNSITVNNCILRNNKATDGGAIYTNNSIGGGTIEPTFTNCLIYSNKAQNGGAYGGSGFCQIYFNSCSITGNTAVGYGGAFYSINYSIQQFYNSIIWNNTANTGNQFYILFPDTKSAFGCILTNCCYNNGTNDVVISPDGYTFMFSSTNEITTDPEFIDPATADYRIYGTSPCKDSGVNGHNSQTIDIRGEARVQNSTIDMGAYEWTSGTDPATDCYDAISVINNNNSGAGSLRQAIIDLCEGGTITLNLAVEWPDNITLTQNFTLDLHGYTLSNTGNYTALIDEGKAVGIKNTASGGSFNAKIAFSSTSSKLALYTENVLGSGFSVSASSAASGLLQIGDGTVAINHTYTVSDLKFNGKISKILVKSSSNLIFNPAIGKK